jgi:excinuclease ABC subunit A
MLDHLLTLPPGTELEIRAPVFKFYGEEYAYLFDHVRTQGYRRLRIDGRLHDISQELSLDEARDYQIEAVIDRFVIKPGLDSFWPRSNTACSPAKPSSVFTC